MNGTLRGRVSQGASPKKAKQMGQRYITDATSQSTTLYVRQTNKVS